ncbi:MAG: hypothetical protein DPW18_00715 [Chloroflexi bacterium]|nr:hypothetical protein [Chloroflexota bacterium]MDL1941330.1 response regulator [Chloroflexi bacterium CFX2]
MDPSQTDSQRKRPLRSWQPFLFGKKDPMNAQDPNQEVQTILIISGDAEMVSLWETYFEQKKYRVISETTAEEGLQTARLHAPALILCALDLPDDEQLSVCRELRAATDGTLLLFAGEKTKPDINKYALAGVDEYIPASVNPMALLIKCMAWLARQDWVVPRRQIMQALA